MSKFSSPITYFFFCLATLSLQQCTEIVPDVQYAPPLNGGKRRVLVEEFTGNRCVQCPAGSVLLANLDESLKENLIVVSIHAGFFAQPWPGNPGSASKFDFRTPGGDFLLGYLGAPTGYPSAVINRKKFPNETDLQLISNQWSSRITAELKGDPVVDISAKIQYNTDKRTLDVMTDVQAFQSISDPLHVTLMITESGIVDRQGVLTSMDPSGVIENYTHNHVLRAILTSNDGDKVADNLTTGQHTQHLLNYTLPSNWNPANCELIAFVHNPITKEVYQAVEVHIE